MGFLKRFLRTKRAAADTRTASKAAKQASHTARSSVVLPSELVLYIFSLAAAESPSSLPLLALLCSETRDRAHLALYTSPVLHNLRQVSLFIRTVRKDDRLAGLVKRIVLDGRGGTGATAGDDAEGEKHSPLASRLAKVLELCRGVEELECRNVSIFALTDFANACNLKHLSLTACVVSDRTTISRFQPFLAPLPALKTLSLHRVQLGPSTAEHFLCPRILPRVVALELDSCRLIEDPATLTDLGPYEPAALAEQLELLHIVGEPEEDPDRPQATARRRRTEPDPFDLVAKCANLRSLSIPVTAATAEVFEHLPVEHLTHLTLLPPAHGRPDVLETHLSAALALSTSFLTLAAVSPPSLSNSSFGSRSPFSHSHSSHPSSPLALSPFSSAGPSPAASLGASSTTPLSQLLELTLPASWDVELAGGEGTWKDHGEFCWALGRILRECKRREVVVRFEEAGEGRVKGVRNGRETMEEVRRVRQAALAA